jgi:hypothetical protein
MAATITAPQADRIHARTAAIVAKMRQDADAAEARGDLKGADALRRLAESRERVTSRVREGSRVGTL